MAKRTRKRTKGGVRQPPVRLCCGERHVGAQCPDGKVMCAVCFERYLLEELYMTEGGTRIDVCQECEEYNQRVIAERQENLKHLRQKAQKRVDNDLLLRSAVRYAPLQEPASASSVRGVDLPQKSVQVQSAYLGKRKVM